MGNPIISGSKLQRAHKTSEWVLLGSLFSSVAFPFFMLTCIVFISIFHVIDWILEKAELHCFDLDFPCIGF